MSSMYTHARENVINKCFVLTYTSYIYFVYIHFSKNCGIHKFVPNIAQLWKMINQRQIIVKTMIFFVKVKIKALL